MIPAGVLQFLGTLAVFLHTLSASFGVDDSPETISAMAMLEHQHPPGYPLFTLLGRLALLLPVGGPGFRISLLAASGAALAAVLNGLIARRLALSAGWGEKQAGLASTLAVIFCAFSWTFWGQALTAKGGAYTLNAAILAGLMLLILAGKSRPGLMAMLAGLGLAHHWMSLLAVAPGLAVLWWKRNRPVARPGTGKVLAAGFILLLGVSTYLMLPIRASTPLLLNWGRPERLSPFFQVVTRSIYREVEEIQRPEGYWTGRLGHLASWGLRESVPWLAWLGIPGMFLLWRRNRAVFYGLATVWAGVVGGALVVSHPMFGRYEITEPYLVPFASGWALATAMGLSWLLAGAGPAVRRIAVAVAAVALLSRGGKLDLSQSYLDYDYGVNILNSSPRDAVVLCEGDIDLFSLAYLREVELRRPDVGVVSAAFLDYDWYRETVHRQLPEMIPREFTIGEYSIKPLRPLVYTAQLAGGEEVVRPVGVVLRPPLGTGWGVDDSLRAWRGARMRGIWDPPAGATWLSRALASSYSLQMVRLATVAQREGRKKDVMDLYARALVLPAEARERGLRRYVYAQMLLQESRVLESEDQLLRAVEDVPWYPRVFVLLANVEFIKGDPGSARGHLLKALELLPAGDAGGERARIEGFLGKLR
jgi:tetratricopeptide (TPR) repeat protein